MFKKLPGKIITWRSGSILAALIITIAGAIVLWETKLEDCVATKRWGVVESGLIFRCGRLPSARMRNVLARHNIRVLIDLTQPTADPKHHTKERAAADDLGIAYYNFALIGDGTGNIEHYALALAALTDARRRGLPALVHCAAGAQRTGGVIAAYRIFGEGWSPDQARLEMQRYGWKPQKDRILLDFLNRNMAELAARLLELDVIKQIPSPLPQL